MVTLRTGIVFFYRCVSFMEEGVISNIDVSSVEYRTPVMLMKACAQLLK